jgi:hypothetical protein
MMVGKLAVVNSFLSLRHPACLEGLGDLLRPLA